MVESSPAAPAVPSAVARDDVSASEDVSEAPAVVAVFVVAPEPTDLESTLTSLVGQDYPNLSILVIDAGNEAPIADRVASIAPDAYLHRLQTNPGFSAAANQALTLVQDATFLLFCDDTVELEPRTVTALAEEMFRSNAGIVTPKFVEWDDPRRLVSVGMGADPYGVKIDLVEPREFDQEQHDGVRDVFVAPRGVQLVRRDLFTTLDGFDSTMGSDNEDLDLCWRAHIAGARIVVNPSTSVRCRTQPVDPHPSRRLVHNRLRSVLVTSSRWTLVLAVPIAAILVLVEAVGLLFAGKRGRAASVAGVLPSMLSELGEIRTRRARLQSIRQVSDHEIRALQVGGSARTVDYFRHRFGAGQDRLAGLVGSVRDNLAGDELTAQRVAALGGLLLALLGIFGSRDLLSSGVAPIGHISQLPDGSVLLEEWWSGWRSAGTGGEHGAPVLFFLLGIARLLFFFGPGLLDTLLVVGPLVVGAIGAWRLAKPLGSARAAIAAAVAYSCNPVPLSIISAGRWQVLVVWAAAPFLTLTALRLQEAEPYDSAHPLGVRLLRFGLLVALVATAAPMVVVLAWIILAGLIIGSVLIARPVGLGALVLAVPASIVVPAALHLPWSFDIISDASWSWFVGPPSANDTFDSMADLVRFAPGPADPGFLIIGILAIAFGSLLIGRASRFDTAARGVTLAAASWGLAWAARRDYLPIELPGADALLCLAAVGVALAVAAAVRSLEVDVAQRSNVVNRTGQIVAGTGLVFVVLLGFQSTLDGRWSLPTQTHSGFIQLLLEGEDEPVRILWIGSPSVLPVDGADSVGGVHFGLSEGSEVDIINRYAPSTNELDAQVGDRLDIVIAGETDRLGRLLAAYGIDLVIVVPALAPPPYSGPSFEAGSGIESVLAQQLDLQRVNGTLGLRVYRNTASSGAALVAGDMVPPTDVAEQLAVDTSGLERSPFRYDRTGRWTGLEGAAADSVLLIDGDGWEADGDGAIVGFDDHFLQVRDAEGTPSASFATPSLSRLLLVFQLLLISVGVVLSQPERKDSL